jgi:hypothetical protein
MSDRSIEEGVAADSGKDKRPEFRPDHNPATGWGGAKSVTKVLIRENGGFDCHGRAWLDDIKGLDLDNYENGIKHVTWEMAHSPERYKAIPRNVPRGCVAGYIPEMNVAVRRSA